MCWSGTARSTCSRGAYPYPIGRGIFNSVAHADIDQDGHDEIFVATVKSHEAGEVARLDGKERRLAMLAKIPETQQRDDAYCRDMDVG